MCRCSAGWSSGGQISEPLRSGLVLDALELALWNRQRAGVDVSALVHHSDRAWAISQPYTDLLAANDVVASVGSRADS